MVSNRMSAARMGRSLCALGLMAILAACSGAVTLTPAPTSNSVVTPPATQTPPPASTPPATLVTAVCPPPEFTPTAPPPASASAPLSAAVPQEAIDAEIAELMAAVGNPDTGSSSEAWDAFQTSLASGDEASIRASADVVLGHLRAACAAVAPYLDAPGADAWAADVRGLLDGMASAIGEIRDAAIDGSTAAVEAGWAGYRDALLDHFYQSFKGSSPEVNRVTLPDGRTATASHIRWTTPVSQAFDGQPTTAWTAGGVTPPQWIELDLGCEATIVGLRHLPFQEIPGATDHLVTVGAFADDRRDLVQFTANTKDEEWLEFTAPAPVARVRFVRVTTLAAPSMIGWREIEVVLAEGSAPGPCPAASAAVEAGTTARANPSTGPSDPALAFDGDPTTGWDPGPLRGEGPRDWIRLSYDRRILVSQVRVLLGAGSTDAQYEVLLFEGNEDGRRLGDLSPVAADGGWASVAGLTPCLPADSVYISVNSKEPPGLIREIQVLGTLFP